jgi:hypothetical protein
MSDPIFTPGLSIFLAVVIGALFIRALVKGPYIPPKDNTGGTSVPDTEGEGTPKGPPAAE